MIDHLHRAMPLIGQRLQQMARQVTVSPPAIEPRILPVGRMEGQSNRLDAQIIRQIWRQKGLKQRGFKWQYPPAVRRSALWEKQQPMPMAQTMLQQLQMKLRLLAITGDELYSFQHKHIVRTAQFSQVRANSRMNTLHTCARAHHTTHPGSYTCTLHTHTHTHTHTHRVARIPRCAWWSVCTVRRRPRLWLHSSS